MTSKSIVPTDKQLEDFAVEEQFLLFCDVDEFTQIARAVLAKWGTPAPLGVEPYCWHYWNIAGTSVFHLERSNRLAADIDASRKHPEAHHVVPLYTTPQPTHVQAGAVPLTDEQIKDMERKHPAEDLCGWSYRLGVADAEAHHGITGGQHDTE